MNLLSISYKLILGFPYIILAVYSCMTGIVYLRSRSLESCKGYLMKTFWAFMGIISLLLCTYLTRHQHDGLLTSPLFFSMYVIILYFTCLIHEKIDLVRKLMLLGILPATLLFCLFMI